MALQNFQYDIIMREYSRRQSQVQHDLEERRKEAFIRVPRLLEIDQEVAALSARKARSLLQGESDTVEDLKKDVAALAQERRTLLRSNGFSGKSCLSQTVKQIKCRKIQNTVCGFEKLAGNTVREKGLAYSGAAVQKQVLCAPVKIIYKVPGSIISPFCCFAGC